MVNSLVLPLAERVVRGHRLGRNIRHDPRSLLYRLDVSGLGINDVDWKSNIPIMDQNGIGKCTAEAATKVLSCDPFWPTLTQAEQQFLNDEWSTQFYADETAVDPYSGTYPPDDTGSDGLTSGKVAQARGLISGYEHTFSVDDALKGLQLRPACWGTLWKSGMDNVNPSTGQVTYTGDVRGGHEIALYKVDVSQERVWFYQSWGSWGLNGSAWISFDDFAASLKDEGDVTFYTPRSQPAPQPIPPSPLEVPVTWKGTQHDVDVINTWAVPLRHTGMNRKAAQAWLRGSQSIG